jgi:hypothetical protein
VSSVIHGKEHEEVGAAAMGNLHTMSAHEVELCAGTDVAPGRPVVRFSRVRRIKTTCIYTVKASRP